MKVPFSYYGSKHAVAHEVWRRFGSVRHYVEPFCGSAAVLLARPNWDEHCVETINDIHGALINFFRAVKRAPDDVLDYLVWPPTELDLIARQNCVLSAEKALRGRLIQNPEYYDARLAAYYCYVSAIGIGTVWERPYDEYQLPALAKRLSRTEDEWRSIMWRLHKRLQTVRVVCGSWKRVMNAITLFVAGAPIGVFLDPPYPGTYTDAYLEADANAFNEVLEWALSNADDRTRIAVCCTPELLQPLANAGWELVEWHRAGGYSVQARKKSRNDTAEAIAFSPSASMRLL